MSKVLRILCFTFIFIIPSTSFATPEVIANRYIIERQKTIGAAFIQNSHYDIVVPCQIIDEVIFHQPGNFQAALTEQIRIVPYDHTIAEKACSEIKKDPAVKTCEPSFIGYNIESVPNDQHFGFQYALSLPYYNGTNTFDMRATQAWDFTKGSSDIVVAVLDSGINASHSDIVENLWQNPGEVANDGVDNDGNGIIDDIRGFDAHNMNNTIADCNGHGSHVSGIIGAKGNNSKGIAGVAWDVKILTIKNAVDCGNSVSYAAVVRGIDYIIDLKKRGVNIVAVNASFGGGEFSQTLYDAIARLRAFNIVFVAGAGNNGIDNDITPFWPSSFDLDNIIAVANVDNVSNPSQLAGNSNYGASKVDLGAPGVSILSLQHNAENYIYASGTSLSTPMVVGGIVLLKSLYPQFNTYGLVIDRVLNTGTPVNFLVGKTKSGAMLNLQTLLNAPLPADQCPNDPLKLAPGACGCGNQDIYSDSDNDSTLDCVDLCDTDSQKTSPGVCSCGVPDTDSDSDGNADCNDLCPTDPTKIAPGVCGCGASDQDANNNGSADCIDMQISAIKPVAPKVTINTKIKKILITIEQNSTKGSQIILKIVSKRKIGKKTVNKTVIKRNVNRTTKISIPAAGTKLSMSYHYEILGPNVLNSAESTIKSISIK